VLGSKAVALGRALRSALLEQHGRPGLPAALSGHDADGKPTKVRHLAFVALPFVGREHADGSVKGMAIVPPRDLPDAERELLFRLIAGWEARQADGCLTLAGEGLPPVTFKRVDVATTDSARPTRWSAPSTRFVTATPIALDRNPGNLRSNVDGTAHKAAKEARETIATACEVIGLPRPSGVNISFAPLTQGAQSSTAYLSPSGGKTQRVRVHAEIHFEVPVRGPVLLGAARHFGLGLCLPVGGVS
jgi:CRISPR-associated protein Csb2